MKDKQINGWWCWDTILDMMPREIFCHVLIERYGTRKEQASLPRASTTTPPPSPTWTVCAGLPRSVLRITHHIIHTHTVSNSFFSRTNCSRTATNERRALIYSRWPLTHSRRHRHHIHHHHHHDDIPNDTVHSRRHSCRPCRTRHIRNRHPTHRSNWHIRAMRCEVREGCCCYSDDDDFVGVAAAAERPPRLPVGPVGVTRPCPPAPASSMSMVPAERMRWWMQSMLPGVWLLRTKKSLSSFLLFSVPH